jgi:hypothetical protein
MADTFRADVVAGLVTIMEAYQTANPTLLRRVFDARPESDVTDLPFAYVAAPREESIEWANGVRTRTMNVSIVVVDQLASNAETMARFDVLVDGLIEHISPYYHITPNTIWDRMRVADEDEPGHAAVRFTIENVSKAVGRP